MSTYYGGGVDRGEVRAEDGLDEEVVRVRLTCAPRIFEHPRQEVVLGTRSRQYVPSCSMRHNS